MNNLSSIRAHLEFIKQRLTRYPVFVRGAGVPVDDPAYVEATRQLDLVRQNLGILIRDLNNRKHLLSAQEPALWTVPRDRRFAQGSSIEGQQ